ncbi:MAG: hypothetical protein G5663_02760 [Serratia symbiotica]|nr:hypothetical protein [Serratia symbiotica]
MDETALYAWYCEVLSSLRGLQQHYSNITMTRALMLKQIFSLTFRSLHSCIDSIFTLMKVPLNCQVLHLHQKAGEIRQYPI